MQLRVVCRRRAGHDRRVRFGRWRISVESQGGRQWFRLYLGRSVVADRLWTPEDLERALEPYGLTVDQFEDEPGNS